MLQKMTVIILDLKPTFPQYPFTTHRHEIRCATSVAQRRLNFSVPQFQPSAAALQLPLAPGP